MARKLRGKTGDGRLAEDVRRWQRDRAFRGGIHKFRLPGRESETLYRVRRFNAARKNESDVGSVKNPGGECDLTDEQISLIERLFQLDTVTAAELHILWPELNEPQVRALVEILLEAGDIEAI